ncbi:hypothetical protein [Megalodesulfovibrio gigas]|uniref:Uncharacterized protein n=1 Tax=Megalodesulfovibrio gigas (strain ATCC 19364 / DSM 1382 / NCIMB 9332 / VKM B-1759) TaxID=1121448 RepID=T2G898_MEGG1|nr:hypothetical protein [Megalodesulfovibrio gigas]AGW12097.1 hypothetical protein DGI_0160 [Megalodesulfovibrio gigas DSM 1382 = ATCC 19364]
MANVAGATTPGTRVTATAAAARRGVVTARLGAGRVLVQAGDASIQATADAALEPGQAVLLLDWPGGVAALPLAGAGMAEREEVICNHG